MREKYTLTVKEFSERERISVSTVKRRIKGKSIIPIKIKRPKGCKGNRFELRISHIYLTDKENFLKEKGLFPEKDELKNGDSKKKQELKPFQIKVADYRLKILKKCDARTEGLTGKIRTEVMKEVAKEEGKTLGTINSYYSRFHKGAFEGLAPHWTNGSRKKRITKEMRKDIKDRYLTLNGDNGVEVCEFIEKKYGDQAPSRRTIYYFITKTWTLATRTSIREPNKFRKFDPFLRRDPSTLNLLDVVILDGKKMDYLVWYKNRLIRPWLYAAMDWKSRKTIAWVITINLNSDATGQVIYYIYRNYGVAGEFYVDNGPEFKNAHILRVCSEAGTKVHLAFGQHPREKPIEAAFKYFTYRHKNFPGWVGHNTKIRDNARLKREMENGLIWKFEDFGPEVDKWIIERNSQLIHGDTKKTPNSFWVDFVPQVYSEAHCDYLLMLKDECKVNDSTVQVGPKLYRGTKLLRLAGQKLVIRRDPKDLSRAVAFYEEKIFEVLTEERRDDGRGPLTEESRKNNRKIRKNFKNFQKAVLEDEENNSDLLFSEVQNGPGKPLRKSDVRHPNVIRFDPGERLFRNTKKALAESKNDELEEAQEAAAGGGRKDIFSKLAKIHPPIVEEEY